MPVYASNKIASVFHVGLLYFVQAEGQCLTDMRAAVSPFGVRGTDYLTTIEYLGGLSKVMDGASVEGVGGLRDASGSEASRVVLVPSTAVDVMKQLLSLNAPGAR